MVALNSQTLKGDSLVGSQYRISCELWLQRVLRKSNAGPSALCYALLFAHKTVLTENSYKSFLNQIFI